MRRMIDPKSIGQDLYSHYVTLKLNDSSYLSCILVNNNPNKFKSMADVYNACGPSESGTPQIPVHGYVYFTTTGVSGIPYALKLDYPQGGGYLWYGKTEIETVGEAQKIKITTTALNTYFTLDSDSVIDMNGKKIA